MGTNIQTMTELEQTTYRARPLPFVLLGLIILAASIGVVFYWLSQTETRRPRPAKDNTTLVELQKVTLSDNQATFTAGGFVAAKYSSNLAAQVSGTVQSLSSAFAVGNILQRGDVLATVDDSDYVAAVAAATASLATAKSTYAQEQAKSRQAARDAKRLGVKSTDLSLRKPQITAAKAAIANAEAQLKLAKHNLRKTTIKAPFNAIVQARNIGIGDSVSSTTNIAQLVDINTFTVKLTLDSQQFNLVNIGDSVMLDNPDTGISYNGIINRFDPNLNESTRTVGAYVDIDKPLAGEKPLLLNTYLQATIVGKNLANSMWIANIDSVENGFVWVVRADKTLAKVPYTLYYRGNERSLVSFSEAISHFVTAPKDSFFAGEKVTTERRQNNDVKNQKRNAGNKQQAAQKRQKSEAN